MSLRLKVFLILGGVMVALFFGVNAVLSRLLTSEFVALEKNEMVQDAARVTDAMRSKMDDLSVKLADWSQWDDTYQYVADRNEDYVASNLQDETFGVLRVDLIVIGDKSGSIVYKMHVENGEQKPFPESMEQHLVEDVSAMFDQGRDRFEDIVSLPEGMLVYAIRPITTSDGSADPDGFMAFGYFFDQADADVLGSMSRLRVTYAPLFGEEALPDDFARANEQLSREHPTFVADAGLGAMVSGYTLVESGHGKPVMLFRVDGPRDIYKKGQESIKLFAWLMASASAVFAVVIFVILDRLVLRKIARLGGQIKKIRESGDSEASIALSGKDEFAGLAKEVNATLESMRENEKRVQQQADEAEKMNRLMVNRELKMIELKQEIRDMKKQIDEQQKKV
jgi:sensor domain CHASE-containing protein